MYKAPLHIFLGILKTSKTLMFLSFEEHSAVAYVCTRQWQVQMLGTLKEGKKGGTRPGQNCKAVKDLILAIAVKVHTDI